MIPGGSAIGEEPVGSGSAPDVPTVPLYHYTSPSGLRNIVDEKALWATHVSYMNDAEEVRYAVRLFQYRVIDQIDGSSGARLAALTQLRNWLRHGFVFQHLLFACSFTSEGNLLSQWRAYCPPSGGVSLGFDPRQLQTAAGDQNFYFAECTYDASLQQKMLDEVLNRMLASAEKQGEAPASKRHPTQSYYDAFEEHEDALLMMAARIKNPAFREEREWRAISRVGRVFATEALSFREGASGLIPYTKFTLPRNANGSLALERVYVGPAYDNGRAFASVETFLSHRRAMPRDELAASGVPWRPRT